MALPSRPNTRIGLPSSPAPRSRSLTARAPRQDIPPRPASSASNERPRIQEPLPPLPTTLRGRRSLNDLTSPAPQRNARIPPPPLPSLKHLNAIPARQGPLESRNSEESITSLASAASSSYTSMSSTASLFSSHSPLSSTSSTSSYDDEEEVSKDEGRGEKGYLQPADGLGLTLWNRVATAAGNLTVSVSKAIETNIVSYTGEVTPAGQESRLTRAMKEYHISKARDPSELPEWLFEERDRGALGRLRIANATPEDELRKSVVPPPRPPAPAPFKPIDVAPTGIMVSRNRSARARPQPPPMERTRSARVRFAEQVHPRQMRADSNLPPQMPRVPSVADSFAMTRTTAVPPVPRRDGRLPDVNLHGRRPSAQGLPSGVRPQRPRVAV